MRIPVYRRLNAAPYILDTNYLPSLRGILLNNPLAYCTFSSNISRHEPESTPQPEHTAAAAAEVYMGFKERFPALSKQDRCVAADGEPSSMSSGVASHPRLPASRLRGQASSVPY